MKTDRELLELAARAAGINALNYCEEGMQLIAAGKLQYWNPLTDDGDALRLAVKLDIGISLSSFYVDAGEHAHYAIAESFSEHQGDKYAATRCAIVRAAAAIWESM